MGGGSGYANFTQRLQSKESILHIYTYNIQYYVYVCINEGGENSKNM